MTSRISEQLPSFLSVRFKSHLLVFILYLMSWLMPKAGLMSGLLWILNLCTHFHLKYQVGNVDHRRPSESSPYSCRRWTFRVRPKHPPPLCVSFWVASRCSHSRQLQAHSWRSIFADIKAPTYILSSGDSDQINIQRDLCMANALSGRNGCN